MLHVVFEDEALLVVNKASGVLSQPGRARDGSVVSEIRRDWVDARGPLLVHRLDMDTSGLLIIGKTRAAHRHLQQQFEHRSVRKRYTALLPEKPASPGGLISLPLAKDWERRPRQRVDLVNGKHACTAWRLAHEPMGTKTADTLSMHRYCRVHLYPQTGRTHQLRVHMAEGLGLPIVGDRLYGKSSIRLMLHADQLEFIHPVDGRTVFLAAEATF